MAKTCSIIDHPADVGLEAHADSAEELFEALTEGMADIICKRSTVRGLSRRTVRVAGKDIETAAVDFLAAVLNVIQVEHFLIHAVKVDKASDKGASAELSGERYDPARHEIATEIKAVTYHDLAVAQQDGKWVGRVILDL